MSIHHSIKANRKIRIGVVGCGKIATNHFDAIQELADDFELIGVCDTHPDNLQQAVTALKVDGYADISSLLNATNAPEVVTLCSPSGLHAKQTIQIAQAGKCIITEKPMATRWSDGIDMVKACDDANVRLFVVKQVRYLPLMQLLKNALKMQRFGKIYLANLNVFWTRPQTYYDQSKWRGTWEFDGGVFMNQASHHIDLLHWLLGPIQNVHAMMSTLAMNIETEDTGVINLRWRSGALGSMNVTMLTYPKNLETSLTILGEKGSVKIGGVSANQLLHWEFDTAHPQDELAAELKNPPQLTSHFAHTRYYQNVSKTLRGEEQAETDGREGLRTLEILRAAYISARDNAQVSLPLIY